MIIANKQDSNIKGTASFSPCNLFRYKLTRDWFNEGEKRNNLLFIMLNPSTADAEVFDPTVRRCFGYAQDWGFNSMSVANIFAYRATDPKDMLNARDNGVNIVGNDNNKAIIELSTEANRIVCAWGSHKWSKERSNEVLNILRQQNLTEVYCLKKSKDGSPCHPLYLKKDLIPIKIL